MKYLILAITLMMVYNISMACTTTTIIVDGNVTVCTVCPRIITCT